MVALLGLMERVVRVASQGQPVEEGLDLRRLVEGGEVLLAQAMLVLYI